VADADVGTGGGCGQAAVFRNPTGSGPAAAVTCADGNSAVVDRYADEQCSSDIRDCKYAKPDGKEGEKGGGLDYDNGEGFSGVSPDHHSNSTSAKTKSAATSGGQGHVGII
jgi:hypothetical protein